MAITTIQASKATPAKGMGYITDRGKADLIGHTNLDVNQDFAKQMMNTAVLWNKAQDENSRKYYHAKISFAPDDWTRNGGTLTEKEALEIGMKLMIEFFPGHECVGAVHTDRKHLHFHGIANSVSIKTGKMVDMRKADYRNFKDRAQEICAERGLTTIDWREATAAKRAAEKQENEPIKDTFAEKGLSSRGKTPWKDELRVTIDYAARTAKNLDEFKAILAQFDVTLTRCTDKTISYKLGDHKACRGDTLGGDYTAQAIRNAINHNQSKIANEKTLTGKINSANKPPQVMSTKDREVFRSAGRQIDLKRSEIDELCDNAAKATWEEKQAAWDAYRQAQNAFWDYYNQEKAKLRAEYKNHYEWRREHRTFMERLYHNHHRGVMASLFLLAVVLIKPDLVKPEDSVLQELKAQEAKLQIEMMMHRHDSAAWTESIRSLDNGLGDYAEKMKELDRRTRQMMEQEVRRSNNDLFQQKSSIRRDQFIH